MDKFLMSSPSQQQFPHTSSYPPQQSYQSDTTSHISSDHDRNHVSTTVSDTPQTREYPESPSIYDQLDLTADLNQDFSYDSTLDFDINADPSQKLHQQPSQTTLVGLSNPRDQYTLPERSLSAPFSVTPANRLNFSHSRNISLDEAASRPSHGHSASQVSISAEPPSGTFTHSYSSNTLQSMDSMPQLSSSASNPSLLGSPHSNLVLTTPGRKQKSASVSSYTNQYTTPLRGATNPSPLNYSKVGKTPHSALGSKGHRRNRSKASLEPSSAHLLATIANMKGSNSSAHSHSDSFSSQQMNYQDQNPFTADFMSPRINQDLSDYDSTPLTTPAAKSNHHPQYFTPISQNNHFGGSLVESSNSTLASAGSAMHSAVGVNNPGYSFSQTSAGSGSTGFRRNDTLDSIKIEDQEDDACKQLKKAKSFTSFIDPNSRNHRPHYSRNSAALSAHDQDAYSSSSTPALVAGSPKKMAYSREHPHRNSNSFKKSASIDLLSPDVMAGGDQSSSNMSALRSYPASIDLVSITQSGLNNSPSPSSSSSTLLGNNQEVFDSRSQIHSRRSSGISRSHGSVSSSQKLATQYPTSMQIQETSATEEIAKFAESILQSDSKRPIYIQQDAQTNIDPKKKHQCPLCLARFQRPEHVKRHLKSHSTEKPFECDEADCGRRFNRKDNLKAHLKKIHGRNC